MATLHGSRVTAGGVIATEQRKLDEWAAEQNWRFVADALSVGSRGSNCSTTAASSPRSRREVFGLVSILISIFRRLRRLEVRVRSASIIGSSVVEAAFQTAQEGPRGLVTSYIMACGLTKLD